MRPPRRIAWTAVIAAAAVLGYVVVELAVGAGASRHMSPETASQSARPSRIRTSGRRVVETPIGERSPQGAVVSAAAYLGLLDAASETPQTVSRLRAATAPSFAGRALQAESEAVALSQRLARSGPAFVRGWRLGYRVDAYSPGIARVAVWAMGMVQSRLEVLSPQFSTTLCTLRWIEGGWRVVAARTNPGPTPPPDGSDPSAVSAFVRKANGYEAFGDAP